MSLSFAHLYADHGVESEVLLVLVLSVFAIERAIVATT
jgi:hypothetical protein